MRASSWFMGFVLTISLGMASGCGDSPTCAKRVGVYTVRVTEMWGTCGPIPNGVLDTTKSYYYLAALADCTGSTSESEDHCLTTATNVTCPSDGRVVSGEVTWSEDGSRGQGVFSVRGNGCSSTYSVSYSTRWP